MTALRTPTVSLLRSAASGSSFRGSRAIATPFATEAAAVTSGRAAAAQQGQSSRSYHRLASPVRPDAGRSSAKSWRPAGQTSQRRSMFIQTESTPNNDSLKFLPGQKVMESGSAEFLDTRAAMTSPLAKQLFQVPGVRSVFYGPDFVTVSKETDTQWSSLKPEIYSRIMEFFTAGHPLFTDAESAQGSSDTLILDTDSETIAMIKELLDTRVRPAIQEDGGDIEYRGFDEEGDGIVRLMLKGSCRGCDSSTVTLKSGIERMLMHYIPEVKGVEQILDQEEEIAKNEFSKLEKKLQHERERESARGFSI